MSGLGGKPALANSAALRVGGVLRCLCDGARLMVGVPRYEDYLAHMARNHAGKPVMTYADFVRDRQAARYGGSGLRCC
jgi:uncharacterized short protein YbdD (DUF466 family)